MEKISESRLSCKTTKTIAVLITFVEKLQNFATNGKKSKLWSFSNSESELVSDEHISIINVDKFSSKS